MVATDFFSANATVYDERDRPFLSDEVALRLATAANIAANARVLDVGAGTGRVAIPLARVGCDVVGVDRAGAMLSVLGSKMAGVPLRRAVADGARLPFSDERFDAVIVARLLYLTPDWRDVLREAIRVVKPGGRVLHEWGNGDDTEELVHLRERARALFERAGAHDPFHPGARSEADIDRFLTDAGLQHVSDVALGPGGGMTLGDFVDRIVTGRFSYTWNVPKEVLPSCLQELKTWAAKNLDLTRSVPVPREQTWRIYA